MILNPAQAAALGDLAEVWSIDDFVLIGATALALHTELTWRRTQDLDLTVTMASDSVAADLARLGWRPDARSPQRWFSLGGAMIDVIPAGAADLDAGRLVWRDGTVMNLRGLALALDHAILHAVGPALEVRVAPLAVIAFLKVVAWLDRPADRQRDLVDLAHLLDAHVGDDDDRRWDQAVGQDFDCAPAFLLGLDLAPLLSADDRGTLAAFLAHDHARAGMASRGPARWNRELDEVDRRVAALEQGLTASTQPGP